MEKKIKERSLSLWNKKIHPRVLVAGEGPPLVFLHGAGGLAWDQFLDELSQTYTVYAPEFPGTSPGEHDSIKTIDDFHDLVIYYNEMLDSLDLESPILVGHSFGGMIAAEIAAASSPRLSKLVLLSPLGLWRDDAPVAPWLSMNMPEMIEVMYHDPKVAARFIPSAEEFMANADAVLSTTWALACAGKFTWPIPDRGLNKRIHRISVPTLLIWGEQDKLVSPAYSEDFKTGIPHSALTLLQGVGHAITHENPVAAARAVVEFASGS